MAERDMDIIVGTRGNGFLNLDVNALPVIRSSNTNLSKNTQAPLHLREGLNEIRYFIGDSAVPEMDTAVSSESPGSLPDTVGVYISDTMGQRGEGVRFARDMDELNAWAQNYAKEFATLSDKQIYIKTVPGRMAYNVTPFSVKAGARMKLIFENPDYMRHNLVLVSPGRAETVGVLADELAARPDGMANAYIPESEYVLFSTPLVNLGQKVEIEFTVPQEPGTYPILCTFPGHWRVMRSETIVKP